MRIELIYTETKRKEFRKKETFLKFLKTKPRHEILQASELVGKIRKVQILPEHLYNFKWKD